MLQYSRKVIRHFSTSKRWEDTVIGKGEMDMKKVLAKKNNKGFSLVELIVVILIMAIIAVALAPQVMKWVGKSGENTDENNSATIKASVQTAVADFVADGNKLTGTYVYKIPAAGGAVTLNSGDTTTGNLLLTKIQEVIGNGPATKSTTNGFTITITSTSAVNASVTVTYGSTPTPTPTPTTTP